MSGDTLIAVGAPAPRFTLPASDGRTYDLTEELAHHHLVLVFYPGNDTPG
jgi:peroxiredoxin